MDCSWQIYTMEKSKTSTQVQTPVLLKASDGGCLSTAGRKRKEEGDLDRIDLTVKHANEMQELFP